MNTIKLNGLDKRLYQLLAPLVMNPEVLKANNNYPFKTSHDFTWFVLLRGKKVKGFLPVEERNDKFVINNYYVEDNRSKSLSLLLSDTLETLGEQNKFCAVVFLQDQAIFEEYGFVVDKEWKLYLKMYR